jgi:DNA-binding LacI/PurR family transcriptional regulator
MPTQQDIANRLDVSVTTVSLALRRDPQISRGMRDRVQAVAAEIGYVYRPRRDSDHPTKRLAFVTSHNMTEAFYSIVLDAAEQESRQQKVALLFAQTERFSPNPQLSHIDLDEIDGLMLIGTFGKQTVRRFHDQGIPIVLIDNNLRGIDLDRVIIANEDSLYRTVQQLASWGHRRIGYIHGPDHHPSFRERLQGYRHAMKDLGQSPLVLDAKATDDIITFEKTAEAIEAWINRDGLDNITAFVACNDKAAIGAIRGLQAKGFHVPGDVSVVGFDDIDAAQIVQPALTTNHVHRGLLGEMAVRLLLERLERSSNPVIHITIDTTFIKRASTRVLM